MQSGENSIAVLGEAHQGLLATMLRMPSYRDFRPNLTFQPVIALSHDGRRVAYADDAAGQFNATVQSVDGGQSRRITSYSDHTVRRVVWHPDGNSLVFQADVNGNENAQIYRIALDDDEPEQLTDAPAAEHNLALGSFSPHGRHMAYSANDRTPADHDILIRDVETGESRRIYHGSGSMYLGHWSPDSAQLSFGLRSKGYDHIVHIVNVVDGSVTRLTSGEVMAAYALGPWLPDGSGFIVRTDEGREFTGLAVMDANDGKLTWLDTPDWDVEAVALSADGRVLVWTVNVDGAAHIRARDLSTSQDLDMPTLPMGVANALTISDDGSYVAMLLSTPTRPWNIAIVNLDTGDLRWLTDAAPQGADPAGFVEPTLIHYSTHDGREIPAYLYRPASSAAPVGVLISIHGGPTYQERPAYIYDGLYQYLLSRGIAVLAPNGRGSTGYGKPYQKLVYRDWGGGDLGDFACAARYLQAQDWADPRRIGLYGASYGGFLVLSCLARLPQFDWAAGVDLFGPSNLITLAQATPPAYRSLVADVIGDPDADADLLLSRSPITYADDIRAPLFVLQGANDPRVPQRESDQLVERLRALGVEVRYDIYPDEGHGFTKSENQVQARSDIAEFLIAQLAA